MQKLTKGGTGRFECGAGSEAGVLRRRASRDNSRAIIGSNPATRPSGLKCEKKVFVVPTKRNQVKSSKPLNGGCRV